VFFLGASSLYEGWEKIRYTDTLRWISVIRLLVVNSNRLCDVWAPSKKYTYTRDNVE
jgi:hypothetical protein